MSNILIGILALVYVYCIEAIVCVIVVKLLKKCTKNLDTNSKGTDISTVRTLHVMALIGVVYFIPLVALVVCLVLNSILIGPIILLILGSAFFVTNKIIIPISKQLIEKYYGKDS